MLISTVRLTLILEVEWKFNSKLEKWCSDWGG